jgi:carbon-monoxide dehydrogenase medium subunit
MISQEFQFEAPSTLNEALALLDRHGEDAKVLSGGMSLVPVMTLGLFHTDVIISLNHMEELAGVREEKETLCIGALTTHYEVATNPLIREHAPLLAEAAGKIGDVQIRNRGTLGGSIAHADPAADYLPVALVLGARFHLKSRGSERTVDAGDFFQGLMMTALEPNELLTEVTVPKLVSGSGSSYQRLHRVEGNFAIVAAAAIIEPGFRGSRLGLGGVGPVPVRVDIDRHLQGGLTDAGVNAIGDAAYEASADAYGDLNGSAEYRREMSRVFARRVVRKAAESVR